MVRLRDSRRTRLAASQQPRNPQPEPIARNRYDIAALLARLSQLKEKARLRTGHVFPIIVIQEAGLDGFWIHRVLQTEGIESHVVDPASIATSRRRRRGKTRPVGGGGPGRAPLAPK